MHRADREAVVTNRPECVSGLAVVLFNNACQKLCKSSVTPGWWWAWGGILLEKRTCCKIKDTQNWEKMREKTHSKRSLTVTFLCKLALYHYITCNDLLSSLNLSRYTVSVNLCNASILIIRIKIYKIEPEKVSAYFVLSKVKTTCGDTVWNSLNWVVNILNSKRNVVIWNHRHNSTTMYRFLEICSLTSFWIMTVPENPTGDGMRLEWFSKHPVCKRPCWYLVFIRRFFCCSV